MQSNDQIKKCTYEYFNENNNYLYKLIDEKCKKYCPLECDSITYTVANSRFGNDRQWSNIYIYFEGLKYTRYSEIPKTEPFNFVSEVGGILSLFIGLSFVSLFELTELAFELCFILFGKKQQKSISKEEMSLEEEVKRLRREINEIKNQLIDCQYKMILLERYTIRNELLF